MSSVYRHLHGAGSAGCRRATAADTTAEHAGTGHLLGSPRPNSSPSTASTRVEPGAVAAAVKRDHDQACFVTGSIALLAVPRRLSADNDGMVQSACVTVDCAGMSAVGVRVVILQLAWRVSRWRAGRDTEFLAGRFRIVHGGRRPEATRFLHRGRQVQTRRQRSDDLLFAVVLPCSGGDGR